MTLHKKAFCIVSLGLLLGSSTLMAAQKSAKEIVTDAYEYIGSLDQYVFDAVVVDNDVVEGKSEQYKHEITVKIDRPGNLRVTSKGDVKNRTITLHDGLFTMYDQKYQYYGQLNTPKNIDKTLDFLFEKYGIRAPLTTLMYSDMHKRIKYKQSKYFGTMQVAGVECDYVAFKTNHKEIHVWITTGDEPMVKTFSIIDGDNRINTSLIWDTTPKFSQSEFLFTAPKGAAKISIQSAH
ncbi:MAG: DUF2092 domain-containing protein [Campylobacterota bacterium]|nr:DUF2092 domain-containing protein [Campylobacterota bacterium]